MIDIDDRYNFLGSFFHFLETAMFDVRPPKNRQFAVRSIRFLTHVA